MWSDEPSVIETRRVIDSIKKLNRQNRCIRAILLASRCVGCMERRRTARRSFGEPGAPRKGLSAQSRLPGAAIKIKLKHMFLFKMFKIFKMLEGPNHIQGRFRFGGSKL